METEETRQKREFLSFDNGVDLLMSDDPHEVQKGIGIMMATLVHELAPIAELARRAYVVDKAGEVVDGEDADG